MQIFYLLKKRTKKVRRAIGNTLKYRIVFLAGFLLLLMCLHIVAMMIFEGLSPGDAAWLTITTATTVGYGDISAVSTAGRWSTFILMYAGGIFVLAQLAGLIFEASQWRITQRQQGKLPIRARHHIVVFGWREDYLHRVVSEIRASLMPVNDEEIVIVSPNIELLPDELRERDVHHVSGAFYDDTSLEKANVRQASILVVLPDTDAPEADFVSLDLVERLRDRVPDTPLVLACQRPEMEAVAEKLGATKVQTFSPNYPDVLTRAILAVGAEDVVEELINHDRAEMIVVHQPLHSTVGEVIDLMAGHAVLLGFRSPDGFYSVHPPRETGIVDDELIFLIDVDPHGGTSGAEAFLVGLLSPLLEDRQIRLFNEPATLGLIGSSQRVTRRYILQLERKLKSVSVTHLAEDCWATDQDLDNVSLTGLDAVVLLADDPADPQSDAKTFVSIRRLTDLGYGGRIIAEAVLASNRERFEGVGASDVIRPVTNNLDILARCVLTGAEEILDNLYSSYGSRELVSFDLKIKVDWGTLAKNVYEIGLPLAWEDERGRVVVPPADFQPGKGRLFMLADKTAAKDYIRLRGLVLTRSVGTAKN